MILSECVACAAALLAGILAGAAATLFYCLGSASRVSRAVFDFLTPLSMGALFFAALFFAADGVFRLYILAAFFAGVLLQRAVHRKISPKLRAMARKVILPIKSLESALESRVERALAPLRERRRARAKARRLRREESRRRKEAERTQKALAAASRIGGERGEKREKTRGKGREKRKRPRQRREGRGAPVSQSD